MLQSFNNITKEQLLDTVITLKVNIDTCVYNDFFNLWESFIKKYADNRICFRDFTLDINSYNETFHYIFNIADYDLNLYFDIERIKKLITSNNIKYYNLESSLIYNNFEYTKEELNITKEKSILPIIVYFPLNRNNTEYLVIDGNHRITQHMKNQSNFKLILIKPFDLRLSCFCDLNSWTLYHFYVNYCEIMTNNIGYYSELLDRNKSLINGVIDFFQDQ